MPFGKFASPLLISLDLKAVSSLRSSGSSVQGSSSGQLTGSPPTHTHVFLGRKSATTAGLALAFAFDLALGASAGVADGCFTFSK